MAPLLILNSIPIKDYKTDPHLSAEVKFFLNTINTGEPGLETLSVKDAQDVLVTVQSSVSVDTSGIDITEKTIHVSDYQIQLTIVKPIGSKEKLPVFIFIHGGGWVLGDFQTHLRIVRDLVVLSGKACVFVNYSRAPEARYPQAINEIYAATKWVAEHGDEINVDGGKIAVIGNSVGGNMAAVISLMAKEKSEPKINLQVLLWPIVDCYFETESYKQFGEQRFLTTNAMKWMFDQYLPDQTKRKAIYVSPLRATLEELSNLPPTLILVAENDILRDEGEAFGRKLDNAGVKVTTVRYNGVIHDFGLLNGLASLPETRSAMAQIAGELKKYLC